MFIHNHWKFGSCSLKIGGELICQSWPLQTSFSQLSHSAMLLVVASCCRFRFLSIHNAWWLINNNIPRILLSEKMDLLATKLIVMLILGLGSLSIGCQCYLDHCSPFVTHNLDRLHQDHNHPLHRNTPRCWNSSCPPDAQPSSWGQAAK